MYSLGRIQDNEKQHKQLTEERLKVLTQHRVHSQEPIFSKTKSIGICQIINEKFGQNFFKIFYETDVNSKSYNPES